jgi:alpha-1,2-mannosyltransferase
MLVVAVAGLLMSPISWTHHWAWLALVPVLLAERGTRSRVVTIALAALVAVAVLAPYGWHLTGAGTVLASFSLVLAGAAVLVAYALDEVLAPRRARAAAATSAGQSPIASRHASSEASTSATRSAVDSMPTAMRTSPGDTAPRADAS